MAAILDFWSQLKNQSREKICGKFGASTSSGSWEEVKNVSANQSPSWISDHTEK